MEAGISSYRKRNGGHFCTEISGVSYYIKDTREDLGDGYSCRLCCKVFRGVSRAYEAPAENKVCDENIPSYISQNTKKYLRNNRQSLEVANIALSLGAIDGFTEENKTQYMFFASPDGTENKQKLTSLIQRTERNDPNRNKDFSPVIIGTGGDNLHVSTLLIDYSNHRLFLFDTSEDIHQDPDPATRTVSASAKIFGNLAGNIRCLNTTGQALQDYSSCTYWATCFADTLQNCDSMTI